MIEDLAFPSAQRGIAVGTIHDELNPDKKARYVALVTSDGGEHWSQVPLKDHPRSLFFLNETTGWMVTDGASGSPRNPAAPGRKSASRQKPNQKLGPNAAWRFADARVVSRRQARLRRGLAEDGA